MNSSTSKAKSFMSCATGKFSKQNLNYMKSVIVVVLVVFSFFGCNKDKKAKYISVDKKIEIGVVQDKPSSVTENDSLAYAELGLKYALNTQAVLAKNLMNAIQKNGTLGALSFCNEKAYPLTDSMGIVHNANIKRVSDKPRNEDNQANAEELKFIQTFKEIIANDELPIPLVKEFDTKVQVYYPILTNAMCLQCHGKPNKDITSSTLKQLALLYPKDEAIGYDVNQVRGIWRVTLDK